MMEKGYSNVEKVVKKRIVDLDETLTPVIKGFYQEEGLSLDALMHAPPVLDFNINEIGLNL